MMHMVHHVLTEQERAQIDGIHGTTRMNMQQRLGTIFKLCCEPSLYGIICPAKTVNEVDKEMNFRDLSSNVNTRFAVIPLWQRSSDFCLFV